MPVAPRRLAGVPRIGRIAVDWFGAVEPERRKEAVGAAPRQLGRIPVRAAEGPVRRIGGSPGASDDIHTPPAAPYKMFGCRYGADNERLTEWAARWNGSMGTVLEEAYIRNQTEAVMQKSTIQAAQIIVAALAVAAFDVAALALFVKVAA